MSDLSYSVRFSGETSALERDVRRLDKTFDGLGKRQRASMTDLAKYNGRLTTFGERLTGVERIGSRMNRTFGGLQATIAALGVGLAVRSVVNATLEWEKYERTLRAVTDSQQAADAEMAFVAELADRLGFSVQSLGADYAALTAASRGTALAGEGTREIFTAVTEAARGLSLGSAETTGALRAIQQMMSKGTVQAEELRGQLGERLPGAFQIAARAMGKTTAELGKMLENGEVLAEDLLPKLAKQLRLELGGAAAAAADSAAAEFGRFETALTGVKVAMGESLLPVVVQFTKYVADTLIPTMGYWLEELGLVERKISKLGLGQVMLEIEDVREELRGLDQSLSLSASNAPGVVLGEDPGVRARLQAKRDAVQAKFDELEARRKLLADEVNRNLVQPEHRARLGISDPPPVQPPPSPPATAPTRTKAELKATKDAAKEQAQADKDAARARRDLANATADLENRLDPLLALQRKYEADKRTLIRAEQDEIIGTDALNTAFADLEVEYNAARREIEERLAPTMDDLTKLIAEQQKEATKQSETMSDVARDLGLSFESAFEKAVLGGEKLRDVLAGLLKDLAAVALRKGVTEPLLDSLSGGGSSGGGFFGSLLSGLGGLFGGGGPTLSPEMASLILHGGGVVGAAGGVSRAVPAAAFAGAPRFHSGGLVGDEVPAVLKRGEEVLTASDPRHRNNGGGGGSPITLTMNVDARGADPGAEVRLRQQAQEIQDKTLAELQKLISKGGRWARTVGR